MVEQRRVLLLVGATIVDFSSSDQPLRTAAFTATAGDRPKLDMSTTIAASEDITSTRSFTGGVCYGNTLIAHTEQFLYTFELHGEITHTGTIRPASLLGPSVVTPRVEAIRLARSSLATPIVAAIFSRDASPTSEATRHVSAMLFSSSHIVTSSASLVVRNSVSLVGFTAATDINGATQIWLPGVYNEDKKTQHVAVFSVSLKESTTVILSFNSVAELTIEGESPLLGGIAFRLNSVSRPSFVYVAVLGEALSSPTVLLFEQRDVNLEPIAETATRFIVKDWNTANSFVSLSVDLHRVSISTVDQSSVVVLGVDVSETSATSNLLVSDYVFVSNPGGRVRSSALARAGPSSTALDESSTWTRLFIASASSQDTAILSVHQQVAAFSNLPDAVSALYSKSITTTATTRLYSFVPFTFTTPASAPWLGFVDTLLADLAVDPSADYVVSAFTSLFGFNAVASNGALLLSDAAAEEITFSLSDGWSTPSLVVPISYTPLFPIATVSAQPPNTLAEPSDIPEGLPVEEVIRIENAGTGDLTVSLAPDLVTPVSGTGTTWATITSATTFVVAPGESAVFRLVGSAPADVSINGAFSARFNLTTNDITTPLQSLPIDWTARKTGAIEFLTLSASHPIDAPSSPQIVSSIVEAGRTFDSRLTLINLSSEVCSFAITPADAGSLAPYWVVLDGLPLTTELRFDSIESGGVVVVQVVLDYSTPQGEELRIAAADRRLSESTTTADSSDGVEWLELVTNLKVTYTSATSSSSSDVVALLSLRPGTLCAPLSPISIVSGTVTNDTYLSTLNSDDALRIIDVELTIGETLELLVVGVDSFGNEVTFDAMEDALTVEASSATIAISSTSEGSGSRQIRVTPTALTDDPEVLSLDLDNVVANQTQIRITRVAVACAAGEQPSESGATCELCEMGSSSESGVACTLCPSGSVARIAGASACTDCTIGTFDDQRTRCQSCPSGSVSTDPISSSCDACPANTFAVPSTGECTNCTAGTARPEEEEFCSLCLDNSISVAGGPCVACEPGLVANSARTVCEPCPAGTKDVLGTCESCAAGEFSTAANITCTRCPMGRFSNQGAAECTACPAGRFSRTDGLSSCADCGTSEWSPEGSSECTACSDEGMVCVSGIRGFLPNYWRSDVDADPSTVTDSTEFHLCDDNVCETSENGTLQCAADHTGPLCAFCREGSVATASGACLECPSQFTSIFIVSVLGVLIIVGLAVMVARSAKQRSLPVMVVRIFINYIQLTASMRLFSSRAPSLVKSMFGIASAADGFSLDAALIECAVDIPFWYQVGIYLSLPIAAAILPPAVVWMTALFRRICNRELDLDWYGALAKASTVVIVFLLYNKVVAVIFSVFDVYPKRVNGKWLMEEDLSEEAYTDTHTLFYILAGSALLVYVIGIPGLALCCIRRHRSNLQDPHFRRVWGFLYDGYGEDTPWWEGAVIIRKVSIVAIGVFATDDFIQIWVASLVVTAALVAHVNTKPFSRPMLNALETMSLGSSLFTLLGSVLYWRYDEDYNYSITAALLLFNIGATLVFLVVFGRALHLHCTVHRKLGVTSVIPSTDPRRTRGRNPASTEKPVPAITEFHHANPQITAASTNPHDLETLLANTPRGSTYAPAASGGRSVPPLAAAPTPASDAPSPTAAAPSMTAVPLRGLPQPRPLPVAEPSEEPDLEEV